MSRAVNGAGPCQDVHIKLRQDAGSLVRRAVSDASQGQIQPCSSRCHVLCLPLCPQPPGGAQGLFLSHDEWTCWPVRFGHGPSHSLLSKFTSLSSGPAPTAVATEYRYHHTQAVKSLEIPSVDGFPRASMLQGLGTTSSPEQAPGPTLPCSPNTSVSSVSPVTHGTDA